MICHHVGQTVYAASLAVDRFVLVKLDTSDLHQPAAQSVSSAQNVIKILPVSTRNVKIHVLEHADLTPGVKLKITIQSAVVRATTLAIHLNSVLKNPQNRFQEKIRACPSGGR